MRKMSDEERAKMIALDEAAEEAGGYVSNVLNNDVHYDLRALIKYCKDKGIKPIDITLRELREFIIE